MTLALWGVSDSHFSPSTCRPMGGARPAGLATSRYAPGWPVATSTPSTTTSTVASSGGNQPKRRCPSATSTRSDSAGTRAGRALLFPQSQMQRRVRIAFLTEQSFGLGCTATSVARCIGRSTGGTMRPGRKAGPNASPRPLAGGIMSWRTDPANVARWPSSRLDMVIELPRGSAVQRQLEARRRRQRFRVTQVVIQTGSHQRRGQPRGAGRRGGPVGPGSADELARHADEVQRVLRQAGTHPAPACHRGRGRRGGAPAYSGHAGLRSRRNPPVTPDPTSPP